MARIGEHPVLTGVSLDADPISKYIDESWLPKEVTDKIIGRIQSKP